jgi:hypothetical protein
MATFYEKTVSAFSFLIAIKPGDGGAIKFFLLQLNFTLWQLKPFRANKSSYEFHLLPVREISIQKVLPLSNRLVRLGGAWGDQERKGWAQWVWLTWLRGYE